jgi:dual specificity MAP kinase phosphatase
MSDTVHGLVYPDGLLESLPAIGVNGANNDGNAPIRLLSASQFAELHLQHTLSHPPDNVLFPFLHGLEGENHAQNTFFASSSGAAPTHATSSGGNGGACSINNSHSGFNYPFQHQHKLIPRIPKYRGLVWVVCEDDLEKAGDGVTLRVLRRKPFDGTNPAAIDVPSSSSSEEEDNAVEEETSDEYEDDFDEDEELMVMGDERLHGRGIISDIEVDVDADADADVEDIESVLASPILSSPVPMQVDSVHVRVAGVDAGVGSESESVCLTDENGIADLPTDLKGDMHYEGKHMHPVSHRPAVSVIAPPMPHGHAHPTHHHPLPITTSFSAHDSSKVDNENSPDNTVSASSSFASSSSLATPSSSSEGETPLSSVFSGDGDAGR